MFPEEASLMSLFDPQFWHLYWALVVTGATATAALITIIGLVTARHSSQRQTRAGVHEDGGGPVLRDHHLLARR